MVAAENLLAPLCRASNQLPNVLSIAPAVTGTAGLSLIAADDVADVIVRQLTRNAVGKHVTVNGSIPFSWADLARVLSPGVAPPVESTDGLDADVIAAIAATSGGGGGAAVDGAWWMSVVCEYV